ncbi:MAG TPA: portal protein, partial [Hyphomicrobiaceae bacterium]|nr:portal protein [Hyphomicrobiaceae bacterium]
PARVMKQRYGEKRLDAKIIEACEKNPDQEFEVRHEVLPADEYDAYKTDGMKRKRGQFASVWIDVAHKKVLRETTTQTLRYVVPRWVTLPSWAYAISPASTIALPDARLIQQQALAILEAAEKSVNPPLVAYTDTIRGDVSLVGGGITWVDGGYDERTGAPVQPLQLGKNFNLGVDSLLRTEAQLTRAFYLDVLRMPDTRNSKSTLEVQFKIDEYVRAALPLFAPMQSEYNDAFLQECDAIIELSGGYSAREKPDSLKNMELVFEWANPLSEMLERQKAQTVSEVSQLGQTIAALEAAAAQTPALHQLDTAKMFRDSVMGIGASNWLLDEDEAAERQQQGEQSNQMQQAMAAAPDLAKLVDSGVGAAEAAAAIPSQAEPGFALLPGLDA